jgi:hypothetical protein
MPDQVRAILRFQGQRYFRIDPIPALLGSADPALIYTVRRDLLGEKVPAAQELWSMKGCRRLAEKQLPNGVWPYPGKSYDPVSNTNYDLLETYRTLRVLVEIYECERIIPVIEKAVTYIFSCQKEEGDLRGIIGNQYMPYYHGAILEMVIKAGYGDDPRVIKGLGWLLSMRQDDGGWVIPAQQVPARLKNPALWHGQPVEPDRAKPHSHLATGMVLRAFAVHPRYIDLPEIRQAGNCLCERIFKADHYNDRRASSYWLKFQFPFWWTTLVTTLDTLSRLGFSSNNEQIESGLRWFTENQSADGLWETGYGSGKGAEENRNWVGLAICRLFQRFFQSTG